MERAKKKVKVKLLNGEEREIEIYAFINPYERAEVLRKFIRESKAKGGDVYLDIDISGMMLGILEKIWADKEVSLKEVSAESVDEIVEEYFPFFLAGTFGARKTTHD